jgi:crotonobetainyl-CoA:carnitine CoA-transferase CaiB-like acyl-CoA transferase
MEFEISGHIRQRTGNRHAGFAPHGVYRALGDDRWVAISVASDGQWHSFAGLLGMTEDKRFQALRQRKAHEEELDARISAWTSKNEAEMIVDQLVAIGIACNVVATSRDLLQDVQLRNRKFFADLDTDGYGKLPFARSPISLDGETGQPARAHALGEDNDHVFKGLLHVSDDEYQRLSAEGVIQ